MSKKNSKTRRKPTPRIVVEDLTAVERVYDDDHARWCELGRRLRELDPARFQRVLAIARGYVSVYDSPDESEEAFKARLRRIGWFGAPS